MQSVIPAMYPAQVTAVKMGAVATKEWEHVGMKEAFMLQLGDYRV